MKSLAPAFALAALFAYGSATNAAAQAVDAIYPMYNSQYTIHNSIGYRDVPVDVIFYLYGSPLVPTVMFVDMYYDGSASVPQYKVPASWFPPQTPVYLTSTGPGPIGSIAYRYTGTVRVYLGGGPTYKFGYTFYDPILGQYFLNGSGPAAQPWITFSESFGVWVASTRGSGRRAISPE